MLNVIFKNHKIKPQIKYKNIIIQAKNLTITNEDSLKYNLNIIKKNLIINLFYAEMKIIIFY